MSADSQYEHEFLPPNVGWQHRGNGGVYAPIDASSNRALPWISAVLAGFAAGGVLVLCLLKPWESTSAQAKAELRAELAQEIADARAESKQAGTDAAIWKNRVMKLEAEANARHR